MFFFSDSLDQKSMLAGHEMRGYLFDQRHGDATLHIQTWCWTSGPAENVAHTTTCPLWSSPDFALVTALPVCLTWTSYYVSRHWSSPPRHDFSAACHRGRGESDRAPQSSFAGVITKKQSNIGRWWSRVSLIVLFKLQLEALDVFIITATFQTVTIATSHTAVHMQRGWTLIYTTVIPCC